MKSNNTQQEKQKECKIKTTVNKTKKNTDLMGL